MISAMSTRSFLFSSSGAIARSSADLPALRQTSERYRLLLENSVDLIVEASREGEILYVSPNVYNVLGYTVGELLHLNVFAHVHPEDLPEAKRQFAQPEGRVICRYRHRNGSWRWVETTGREFLGTESQVRSVLIVRDITERKEAEMARRSLEGELYKNSKLSALGMLAGGIAHDFNNILTVTSVHLSMAQEDTNEPKVQAALSQIEEALGKAKQLAQQILKFSRHQHDSHQLVRLTPLITEVLQLLRPTWPTGVEIVTDLPSDGGWIMGSPIQLHQVLTNLFVNAAHAMESSPGRLEVRVSSLAVEQPYADPNPDLDRGHYIQLTVSDTGHGMDTATRQQIFEPFFTTKRQGTGLGLAVVNRIVKDHGACIRVSSELGRGTTFRLFFTAQPNAEPTLRPAGASSLSLLR